MQLVVSQGLLHEASEPLQKLILATHGCIIHYDRYYRINPETKPRKARGKRSKDESKQSVFVYIDIRLKRITT